MLFPQMHRDQGHSPVPSVPLLSWFSSETTFLIALKGACLAPGHPQAALELLSLKPRVCFESNCQPGCQEVGLRRFFPFLEATRQGCILLARQGLGPSGTDRSSHGHLWTGPCWTQGPALWGGFPLREGGDTCVACLPGQVLHAGRWACLREVPHPPVSCLSQRRLVVRVQWGARALEPDHLGLPSTGHSGTV